MRFTLSSLRAMSFCYNTKIGDDAGTWQSWTACECLQNLLHNAPRLTAHKNPMQEDVQEERSASRQDS